MNDREKQILEILRRNPLIQQNEIADILQISRSRVAAHIMDLMRKGLIKGKGYHPYRAGLLCGCGCNQVMDIRGMADIRYLQAASHRGSVHCSAGGVGRNIAHNLALLGRDVHLISAIWQRFLRRDITGRNAPRERMNVSNCIRLHGHSTATYLAIANKQEETITGNQ
ncbi:PfkB family carbohydrate kinase [Escherichia coli]|nr:PfkB family carbohydrate kinase [Escherichia coli]